MRRTAMLPRSPMKTYRPKPAVPPAVKALLMERANGYCEAQLSGCQRLATDACHRIGRKAGGRPKGEGNRLANLWAGCRTCHRWATANPAEAYDLGLALREHQDPTVEPMAYMDTGWVRLDDEGGLWPVTS